MTRDPLLTLSDTQSDAVRRGADMLHPSLREKFLASVQDRLLSLQAATRALHAERRAIRDELRFLAETWDEQLADLQNKITDLQRKYFEGLTSPIDARRCRTRRQHAAALAKSKCERRDLYSATLT